VAGSTVRADQARRRQILQRRRQCLGVEARGRMGFEGAGKGIGFKRAFGYFAHFLSFFYF
jgi:hypothetical protein